MALSSPSFTLPVKREELSDRAQQELAIAIAELVSNAVRHAGGGEAEIRAIQGARPGGGVRWGVEVVVRDCGPGLDPRLVTEEGAATQQPRLPGQGLGVGLGAVHRLMSSVQIRSDPGVSTEIIAIKWP
jgi:serine/threonine-protein kinase RsbT